MDCPQKRPAKRKSYIYFLFAPISRRMKIGFSRTFATRLKKIQSTSPESLEVLRVIEGNGVLEKMLHRLFAGEHEHGEWFHATEDMIEFVQSLEENKHYSDVFSLLEKFRKKI